MKRFSTVKKGLLFMLGTVVIALSCSSPTMPRLPRDDEGRPVPDTTKTGMRAPVVEVRGLA